MFELQEEDWPRDSETRPCSPRTADAVCRKKRIGRAHPRVEFLQDASLSGRIRGLSAGERRPEVCFSLFWPVPPPQDLLDAPFDLHFITGILGMEILAAFQGIRQAIHVGVFAFDIVSVLITFSVAQAFHQARGRVANKKGN